MNCAKSVKMIVILGCIVVNLVGCGMNDTTASSMSTVVSSQDTSSSSCNSEEKNDLQDFSQTLVDSTSVFLDQDQYTVFEKAQKIDYALWGQSSNLKGLNFKIEDAPTFVPMTQNAPTYVKLNGHDYEVYQNSYKEFEEYMKSIFTNDFLSQDSIEKKFVNYNGKLAVCDDYDLAQIPYFTGYVGEYYPDDFCSVRYYLKNKTEYGWYFCLDGRRIIGGLGVIDNDFHDRKDLSPNVCALYTEEDYRCQGIAGQLLDTVVKDMKSKGITPIYLITDHTSFYERYGWEFLCMVQGDDEPDMTRMYIHR